MIIDSKMAAQLATQELYLEDGIALSGNGFLGKRCEIFSKFCGKVSSLAQLSLVNFSSYTISNAGSYENVAIGAYCSLAEGVKILGSHDFNRISTSICTVDVPVSAKIFSTFKGKKPYVCLDRTYIGHDVWLGSNVQIKCGITIGHGAIVGAGSVVTKHIPPYAVVGGSPAKIIRLRFPEKDIERLIKSAWYTYDWDNIEVDWGNMHNALSIMEDYIAAQDVPLLGQGFAYKCTRGNAIQLIPATWTLERDLESIYDTSDMLKIFEHPSIKDHALQL